MPTSLLSLAGRESITVSALPRVAARLTSLSLASRSEAQAPWNSPEIPRVVGCDQRPRNRLVGSDSPYERPAGSVLPGGRASGLVTATPMARNWMKHHQATASDGPRLLPVPPFRGARPRDGEC